MDIEQQVEIVIIQTLGKNLGLVKKAGGLYKELM